MPDVQLYIVEDLSGTSEEDDSFLSFVTEAAATWMSCRDDDGKPVNLDPITQIDLTVIWLAAGVDRVNYKVALVIEAFDYVNRMANMNDRLKGLKTAVAEQLEVDPSEISIRFRPTPKEYWV